MAQRFLVSPQKSINNYQALYLATNVTKLWDPIYILVLQFGGNVLHIAVTNQTYQGSDKASLVKHNSL